MNTFRICRLSLTPHQFRFLAALGLISALAVPLWVPRARPWQASTWLEILFSSQIIGFSGFAAILWFIYLGLSNYKKRGELRRYERLMLLFWGAYAGSSLSTLLGT
ncbi:hypothetical protein [Halopseudomonas sp.]|uniref:hypothetical protein n=1 Tax=Halopseudomonas sp. TaxID=2901191 RepID=UPI0030018EBF